MIKQIFSGYVQVEIQGPKVLRLLRRTIEFAEYEVVGFEEKVVIHDTRFRAIRAIDYLESTGDARYFPEEFSSPAYTQIVIDHADVLRIYLSDHQEEDLDYILWIAIGISDEIPNYSYLFKRIEFLRTNTIGMISVFFRTRDGEDGYSGVSNVESKSVRAHVESLG